MPPDVIARNKGFNTNCLHRLSILVDASNTVAKDPETVLEKLTISPVAPFRIVYPLNAAHNFIAFFA